MAIRVEQCNRCAPRHSMDSAKKELPTSFASQAVLIALVSNQYIDFDEFDPWSIESGSGFETRFTARCESHQNGGRTITMTTDYAALSQLPRDEKRFLVARLARELMGAEPGPLALADSTGEIVVYALPANARANAERALRETDPATLADLHQRSIADEDLMTVKEVLGLNRAGD